MNTSKCKTTTVLTGEDFPSLSRHSTKTLTPKFLSITPPHENLLFSETAGRQEIAAATTSSKTLLQTIATGCTKSKLKTENLTVIKTCPTTARQRDVTKKKKTPIKKSQILSNIISNNIYNNLHHFDNDVVVQVDSGNTKANRSNVHETSIEVKSFEQKQKKFDLLWNYFMVCHSLIFLVPCVSKSFYSNPISKSRSHLIFTVKLSFYVLFLRLIFRNYLLSPKWNHGFSGDNTTFLKISYK